MSRKYFRNAIHDRSLTLAFIAALNAKDSQDEQACQVVYIDNREVPRAPDVVNDVVDEIVVWFN